VCETKRKPFPGSRLRLLDLPLRDVPPAVGSLGDLHEEGRFLLDRVEDSEDLLALVGGDAAEVRSGRIPSTSGSPRR